MRKLLFLFLIGFELLVMPLSLRATKEPLVLQVNFEVDLRPMVGVLTAPFRFVTFVKEQIDAQGNELSQKTLALLRSPYVLTNAVKKGIDLIEIKLPQQLASLVVRSKGQGARTIYEVQPRKIAEPSVIARSEATKQSQIQDTKYSILNTTKEIIREIVTRIDADSNAEKRGTDLRVDPRNYPRESASIDSQLASLRTEFDDSLRTRINALSGKFGFTSNRFDELTAQKGLVAGSGNVKIIDSSGRIPELSSTYFASLPNIFSSIGNASSTVQFTASQFQDTLSFEGVGGTTISFDSTNKKITISTTSPTLLNVLNQGADASTFTGTTKIGGLTIDSSGNLTLAGTFAIQGNATSTIENNLWVKGSLRIGTSSITLSDTGISSTGNITLSPTGTFTISTSATSTIQGPLVAGSGNVLIIDATGKISALSSTYFADLSGANLTSINADNISSGTLAVARGGTGTGATFTQGSLIFTGASGIYSQNNANLFWDDTNKRLGIGTATPSGTLHISTASSTNALVIDSAGNVGIGTATPGSKLTVAGTIESTSGGVKFPDATTQTSSATKVTTVRKTANENVNNSTTLQNDDALFLAMAANETWFFSAWLDLSAAGGDTIADVKIAFTVPAGASLGWSFQPDFTPAGVIEESTRVGDSGTAIAYPTNSAGTTIVHIKGFVAVAGTAGTLQMQWAQNTAAAVNTTIGSGSYLEAHK